MFRATAPVNCGANFFPSCSERFFFCGLIESPDALYANKRACAGGAPALLTARGPSIFLASPAWGLSRNDQEKIRRQLLADASPPARSSCALKGSAIPHLAYIRGQVARVPRKDPGSSRPNARRRRAP